MKIVDRQYIVHSYTGYGIKGLWGNLFNPFNKSRLKVVACVHVGTNLTSTEDFVICRFESCVLATLIEKAKVVPQPTLFILHKCSLIRILAIYEIYI